MKQRAFRQIPTGYKPSKKACPRLWGQAAMSMYYIMSYDFCCIKAVCGSPSRIRNLLDKNDVSEQSFPKIRRWKEREHFEKANGD